MSKLSYEDKINIYLKKKNGQSRKSLSREYKVNELIITYLYYLIDKHGYDILRKNKKWYMDVTEFNLRGEKCYLSPILDGFNGEVISYNTSKLPNLEQTNDMLTKAFNGRNLEGLILHSDQG